MPIGTPAKLPSNRISAEPAIAFAMPPPNSPGGLGVCVRKARLIEPRPLYSRYPNTAPSGRSTRTTAASAAHVANPSTPRRHKLKEGAEIELGTVALDICPRGCASSDGPHQYLRQYINNNGNDEER